MFVFLLRPEEYTIHEQSDSDLDDQPGGELEEPDENDHGSTRIDRCDAAATLDGEDAAQARARGCGVCIVILPDACGDNIRCLRARATTLSLAP